MRIGDIKLIHLIYGGIGATSVALFPPLIYVAAPVFFIIAAIWIISRIVYLPRLRKRRKLLLELLSQFDIHEELERQSQIAAVQSGDRTQAEMNIAMIEFQSYQYQWANEVEEINHLEAKFKSDMARIFK